ncbi:histidine kinase [Ammonicoccus fulvus]|uniref:histidine kinase n=1 Tax=Ammonicoccus fulvus TaxID=3138240 RepID=A0ABZ3FP98_9ACTN
MSSSRRISLLIDGCLAVQVLMILASALMIIDQSLTWGLVGIGSGIAIGLGWILYRVRGWVVGLWLVLAASIVGGMVDGGMVALLLLLIGLAVIVVEQGIRWGLIAGLAVVLALAVIVWIFRDSVGSVVSQSIGNIILVALGLVGGLMLLQLRRDREANQRLLAELRASVDIEKELMLADERSRSARDLHDGLGHWLTLIAMNLEYAQRVRDSDPTSAWTEVAGAREEARDALAYMRRWVRALNPPREPNLSGSAALEAIADSFRGTGLNVSVSQTGQEQPMGRETSLFAYRLVQEGLTNVLRHSSADRVDITLRWLEEDVELELADNGGGGTANGGGSGGFGLRSLEERARELGGTFHVRDTGEGVVLTGRVPAPRLVELGDPL